MLLLYFDITLYIYMCVFLRDNTSYRFRGSKSLIYISLKIHKHMQPALQINHWICGSARCTLLFTTMVQIA